MQTQLSEKAASKNIPFYSQLQILDKQGTQHSAISCRNNNLGPTSMYSKSPERRNNVDAL